MLCVAINYILAFVVESLASCKSILWNIFCFFIQNFLENFVRPFVFILSILYVGFTFLGCSMNLVEMKYSSSLKQNYHLNVNAPIIVAYHKGDLLAASYIPFVIEMLGRRGFNSIYVEGQIPLHRARNIIYVSLVKTMKSYPTSNVEFVPTKMLDKSSCINYDGMYYCREEVYPIITGYSTSLNLSSEYHFIMDWYDIPMKKRILYIDGSIGDGPCIFEGIYQDLIYQTITRIDFSRPEVYSYNSALSYYNFNCILQRTKTLGTKR